MGYVMMHGFCLSCNKLFGFNPHKVPSYPINGQREPVCKECIDEANPQRIANGLDPIIPDPTAYEPIPENQL